MNEVKSYLQRILKTNAKIVVACSGGPDSMFLLHLVNSLKDNLNLKIICAHVNHNVRKESLEEAKFVENYCVINNIIFEYKKFTEFSQENFSESEAHYKRYAFFEEVLHKYKANILLTAHHGDDLIETILMRIGRGSNLKGYKGISKITDYKDYQVIRPLLTMDKEEILDYLKSNNISYVVDKTNNDNNYLRNRYQKQVLPFLKKEDHKIHLKYIKFSEELNSYYEYIRNLIISKKSVIFNKDGSINIHSFLQEDSFMQKRIIEYYIEQIQKSAIFHISDNQVNELVRLIKSENSGYINLANNFIAKKRYNYLKIEKNELSSVENYLYELKKKISLPNGSIWKIKDITEKSNNIIRLASKELNLPLFVRNASPLDKIHVKNMVGTKKVVDILKDNKIELEKRRSYPVVVDSKNTVIWIPGLKKSIFDKENGEKYDIILKYTEEKNEYTK